VPAIFNPPELDVLQEHGGAFPHYLVRPQTQKSASEFTETPEQATPARNQVSKRTAGFA
jgi:hypothetical protein